MEDAGGSADVSTIHAADQPILRSGMQGLPWLQQRNYHSRLPNHQRTSGQCATPDTDCNKVSSVVSSARLYVQRRRFLRGVMQVTRQNQLAAKGTGCRSPPGSNTALPMLQFVSRPNPCPLDPCGRCCRHPLLSSAKNAEYRCSLGLLCPFKRLAQML